MNDTLFHLINGVAGRSGALDWAMALAARDLIYLAIPLLGLVWFHPIDRYRRARAQRLVAAIAIACVFALALSWLAGQLLWETRPFAAENQVAGLIAHEADNSFPSTHAAAAFAIGGATFWLHRRLGVMVVGSAMLIGTSRVFVGVHWPGDVLAGAAIGLFSGTLAAIVLEPMMIAPQRWLAAWLPIVVAAEEERQ